MREQKNNFTVGFDTTATSVLSTITIPADPVAGTLAATVTGELINAGVNETRPSRATCQRRSGRRASVRVDSIDSKPCFAAVTAAIGRRGNHPVPSNATSNYGQIGYTNNTVSPQTAGTPTISTEQPVSERPRRDRPAAPPAAERRRHDDQLCRSESHRAARAGVLR